MRLSLQLQDNVKDAENQQVAVSDQLSETNYEDD